MLIQQLLAGHSVNFLRIRFVFKGVQSDFFKLASLHQEPLFFSNIDPIDYPIEFATPVAADRTELVESKIKSFTEPPRSFYFSTTTLQYGPISFA